MTETNGFLADARVDFGTHPPFEHQRHAMAAGVYHLLNHGLFLSFLDMGLGKSYLYAQLAAWLHQFGYLRRALFVTSNSFLGTNDLGVYPNGMAGELHRWGGFEDLTVLDMPGARRREQVREPGLYITNWQGLLTLYPKPVYTKREEGYDLVVFDEAHNGRNLEAKTHWVAGYLSQYSRFRILGTGTAIADHPRDLFGLMLYADQGETLGTDQGAFHDRYFEVQYGLVGFNRKKATYTLREEMRGDLIQRVYGRGIHYVAEEVADMPGLVLTFRPLYMSPRQRAMYDEVVARFLSRFHPRKIPRARAALMRMAGGYGQYEDLELVLEADENPKLKALAEIADENDGKIIVFTHFRYEVTVLECWAEMRHESYVSVYSGKKASDRSEAERNFQTVPHIKWFFGTAAACRESLNLWASHVLVYYSLSEYLLDLSQSIRRARRPQQKAGSVRVVVLGMINSIEESITHSILNKKSRADSLQPQTREQFRAEAQPRTRGH